MMVKEETEMSARSAEMHWRGHAYYATACPTRCDQVAKWAARRLISPRGFLIAARASLTLAGMAAALGVMPDDILAYLTILAPEEWLAMQSLIGRGLHFTD